MYIYCKRNKYISKKFFGKNNKGHITIRSKQKLFIKLTQLKNINYNYYFFKNIKNYIDINKKLIIGFEFAIFYSTSPYTVLSILSAQ